MKDLTSAGRKPLDKSFDSTVVAGLVAKKADKEYECTAVLGGLVKRPPLFDGAAILACSADVGLNPLQADFETVVVNRELVARW